MKVNNLNFMVTWHLNQEIKKLKWLTINSRSKMKKLNMNLIKTWNLNLRMLAMTINNKILRIQEINNLKMLPPIKSSWIMINKKTPTIIMVINISNLVMVMMKMLIILRIHLAIMTIKINKIDKSRILNFELAV